jgi:hypothetical protein
MTFALMALVVLLMLSAGVAQQRFVNSYRAQYGVGRTPGERARDLTDPQVAWRRGRVDAGLVWRHHLKRVEHDEVERRRRQMVVADLSVVAGLATVIVAGPRADLPLGGLFVALAMGLMAFWAIALVVGLAQHWPRTWLLVCGVGVAAAGIVLVLARVLTAT